MNVRAGSIQEMYAKFKHLLQNDAVYYGVLIVLVGSFSFVLGQYAVGTSDQTNSEVPIVITQEMRPPASSGVGEVRGSNATQGATPVVAQEEEERTYVASKNSDKYHLPWCPSVSRIKEENRIYFSSKSEAEAAGYVPASNCEGI